MAAGNNDFLISLGYDPTDAKKGLEKALDDLNSFKVKAAQVQTELTQTQVALSQQYTAASVKAAQERAAAIQKEVRDAQNAYAQANSAQQAVLAQRIRDLNDEYLANQKIINGHSDEVAKINQLKQSYAELRAQMAQTRAAQGVLKPQAQGQEGLLGKSLGSINAGEVLQATGILGLGASLPFAIHKIAESMKELVIGTGEYAKQLEIASAKTGIAVPELQQFAAVGKLFGLSIDDAAVGMRKFSAAIIGGEGVGEDGITPAANKGAIVLRDLGVQIVKTATGATDTAATFAATGEAIGKISDPALRAQAAIDVFGKSGLNFLPLFVQGKEKIQEFSAEFAPFQTNLDAVTEAYQRYEIAEQKSALANQALGASFAPLLERWTTFKTLIADATTLLARKPGRFFSDLIGAASPGGAGRLAADVLTAPYSDDGQPSARPAATPVDEHERQRENQLRADLTARRDASKQKEIEREEQAIADATAEGQRKLVDVQAANPKLQSVNDLQSSQRQLDALKTAAPNKSGEALLENLREQAKLVKQIYDLKVKIVEEDKKSATSLDEAKNKADEVIQAAEKQQEEQRSKTALYDISRIAPISGPAPIPGGISPDTFKQQFEVTSAKQQVGIVTPEQEVAAQRTLLDQVKQEIAARIQGGQVTGLQLKQLQEMAELAKKIKEEIAATGKQTDLGQFLEGLKGTTELISRFSGGFKNTNFPKWVAAAQGAQELVGTVAKAGGGTEGDFTLDNFVKGLKDVFGNAKTMFKDLGDIIKPLAPLIGSSPIAGGAVAGFGAATAGVNAASGAASKLNLGGLSDALSGPLGAAMGIAGAVIGGIMGNQQKQIAKIGQEIRNEINKTLDALRSGAQGISTTLTQLEQQRAQAVSQLSGKKGGNKELQQILPNLDQQIADLEGQQKKIVDDFHKSIAELSIPEAAGRSTIDQIAQIAKTLNDAALAGASAGDQMKYLNEAMNDLKVSVGKDLRDEEQQTLDLLQKEIDLQQQKTNLVNQAYEQQRGIQNSLALNRAQTPAQSAALQIREVGIQRDQQLQQLDMQDQVLKAQIDGQAQLFGWTLKDLQSADAKTELLKEQVDLTKQITAETITTITANQQFLASLKNGQIPALPAGLLPSNFAGWPSGSAYQPTPGATGSLTPTVNITINAPGGNARAISDALRAGFKGVNFSRQFGFE